LLNFKYLFSYLRSPIKKHIFILFFFFYTNLFASQILLYSDSTSVDVLSKASVLIDKNSKKNISEILKSTEDFKSVPSEFINYGYMFKDTLWVKFDVHNNSDKDILKYLVFDSPNIDIINLHFQKDNKEHLEQNGIFNRKSFESELAFSFKLNLKANETITYYLELKPITHSLHFTLKIKDYKTFKNDDLHHQLLLTIFFGILFVIMIYNLVIYINSRDTVYVYYSIFILSIFIHHLSIRGMVAYFMPSNQDAIIMQAYMPIYNLAFAIIAIFMFVRSFLNIQRYKKLYFVLKIFVYIVLIISILNSKENYILNYLTPFALLFAVYIEFIGLYLFIKTKEKNAKYFFMIWSISLAGMVGTMLYYVGILPSAIPYLFEITVIIETFLFSIVLSSQIKSLQAEKLEKDKLILEQSKLASMGEMMQNIAHQWRQPLSEINAVAMKIDADFYKKRLDAISLEGDIQRIENITYHMSNTIESFNSYFKENKQVYNTSIKEVIDKALNIMSNSLKEIKVDISVHDNSKININLSEFIQVITVILNNAIDALYSNEIEKKMIYIKIDKLDLKYILEIEDNAGGIKEENINKIFEPYFTTKFKSNGIGVGLYMSKMLIEESLNGSLTVSNTKNGAKFKIIL